MSERLEEMLRIARAATKGPWETYQSDNSDSVTIVGPSRGSMAVAWGADLLGNTFDAVANAQHIATFNPRTAEALVKVALAAKIVADLDGGWRELREALAAFAALTTQETTDGK